MQPTNESAETQGRQMSEEAHGYLNAHRGCREQTCSYEHWSLNETRREVSDTEDTV